MSKATNRKKIDSYLKNRRLIPKDELDTFEKYERFRNEFEEIKNVLLEMENSLVSIITKYNSQRRKQK